MPTVEAASQGGSSSLPLLIFLVLAMAGLFLLSRRTQKKQRSAQEFRQNLAPGQDVMTASGMLGRVVAVDGDEITIESTPGHRSRWIRGAIAKVIEPTSGGTTTAPVSTTTENGLLGGSADSIEIPDDLSGLPDDGDGRSQQGPSTTK